MAHFDHIIQVSESLLEIYHQSERIASHRRFPDYVTNGWSTHEEDMPDHFQRMEWDDQRIRNWAVSIGADTAAVIDRIFSGVKIKEQGYNSCLSVLRLSKAYSKERLEIACALGLTKFHSPRYRHLKAILAANEDRIYKENQKKTATDHENTGYVRGASYYGGNHNDQR